MFLTRKKACNNSKSGDGHSPQNGLFFPIGFINSSSPDRVLLIPKSWRLLKDTESPCLALLILSSSTLSSVTQSEPYHNHHRILAIMRSAILLAGVASLLSHSMAEELDAKDVPASCKTICQPIVDLSNTCDIDPKENKTKDRRGDFLLAIRSKAEEAVEANCICTNKSFDVATVMALCASCMAQNSSDAEGMKSNTIFLASEADQCFRRC